MKKWVVYRPSRLDRGFFSSALGEKKTRAGHGWIDDGDLMRVLEIRILTVLMNTDLSKHDDLLRLHYSIFIIHKSCAKHTYCSHQEHLLLMIKY